jgi:two-component system LytT family response regulator
MLRTIIIDDEPHMRLALGNLVKQYCPGIEVVAKADGVKSGVEAIKKYHPDLILLDIKMEDGTGFDLLQQLDPVDFKVIFITAYDEFAIKAFRFSALDYLLKPVDPDELIDAVGKAGKIFQDDFNTQLNTLNDHLQSQDLSAKKLIVKTSDSIHLIDVNEILYCESDGGYTELHIFGGKRVVVSSTLKEYEDLLTDFGFFRVHKSFLINMKFINRFDKADGGFIILTGEFKIPVASRKKDLLMEMFDRLTQP